METVLEVKNLSKTFTQREGKGLAAVRRVSFSLAAGERLGIVGESGSGKTTLARLVTRLADPTEGQVFLEGEEITRLRGAALRPVYRKLQMVFQSPQGSFDPRRRVGEGVGESLANLGVPRGERQERVAALLAQCGLEPELAARYPHQLSGGQCQRAAIARALAVEPRVLVCDEATSSLDVTVQQQILALLDRLGTQRQLSFLFICHNLALVQAFCSRVLVMHQGRVVEEGPTAQVIAAPRDPYTRQLVEAAL